MFWISTSTISYARCIIVVDMEQKTSTFAIKLSNGERLELERLSALWRVNMADAVRRAVREAIPKATHEAARIKTAVEDTGVNP